MNVKNVFFGTHEFAATILEGLAQSPLFSVDLVVTQPDRPVGRTQEMEKPPVKVVAEKLGIPTDQPETLKSYELRVTSYDIAIVAQYGLIIPKEILELPKYGTINVHTSLLPKYRGASPIQSALLNGETETGVTIMLMDEGLDTGPILLQKTLKIAPDDTYPILDAKLAKLALEALTEAVEGYVNGGITPTPQDASQATLCKKLSRDDGKIDWHKSSQEIYNQYRALTPWPGVWTMWNGKRLKLLVIQKNNTVGGNPGTVSTEHGILTVRSGTGSIGIIQLQLEGKKPMSAAEFQRGYPSFNMSTL